MIISIKGKVIMSEYKVSLSGKAKKQLDKLELKIVLPIFTAIKELKKNPRPQGYIN